MIVSGWILPDYYEAYCPSASGLKDHVKVVIKYLARLQDEDIRAYELVSNMISRYKEKRDFVYDDFAIYCLGWIKLNNNPYRRITCCGWEFQMPAIIKYTNIGFDYSQMLRDDQTYLKINIDSRLLLE